MCHDDNKDRQHLIYLLIAFIEQYIIHFLYFKNRSLINSEMMNVNPQ